ncbi:hypothetical protein HMPREF1409_01344 [Helicobacter pylori GAM246Ai]|nr:hypothetical protein HMPREF1409_01344 [Helicobacter pylori GAM246Ai]
MRIFKANFNSLFFKWDFQALFMAEFNSLKTLLKVIAQHLN